MITKQLVKQAVRSARPLPGRAARLGTERAMRPGKAPDRVMLVRNIGQLVTMAGPPAARSGEWQGRLGLVAGGAVLIVNGAVAAAGPEENILEALGGYPKGGLVDLDAGGALVTPGLVDAHTHLIHAGSRAAEFEARALGASYAEILAAGGGIHATVAATRAATLSDLITAGGGHLREMLACGTTTVEAKSGYGLDLDTELRQLEAVRVLSLGQPVDLIPTFLGAHAVPPGEDADEYVRWLCECALPGVAAQGVARFNDVFCERGAFSAGQAWRVLRAGLRHGLAAKIHADELSDGGGAEVAAQVGAVSADHLHHAGEPGLRAMAAAGTVAVLLPGTAVCLGLREHAPARRMVDLGVPVALGTDFNPGSCYCRSLPLIVSLACSQLGLTPAEALVAATVNAAFAGGVGGSVGSLERGKQGDLVVWDADDYRMIAYEMGGRRARTVLKRGRVVHSA